MKQGTVSVLVGCHSPIHSLRVIRSWRILYGRWPSWWQVVCIFLHDVGHWGKNYLDNVEEKREHWKLGARIAKQLFGQKGYDLVAGHCPGNSGAMESALYRPDKHSWYDHPRWWAWIYQVFEPKLKMGLSGRAAWEEFNRRVKVSIESGTYGSSHGFYLAIRAEHDASTQEP